LASASAAVARLIVPASAPHKLVFPQIVPTQAKVTNCLVKTLSLRRLHVAQSYFNVAQFEHADDL